MHRSCRTGRAAWQRLDSGTRPSCPSQPGLGLGQRAAASTGGPPAGRRTWMRRVALTARPTTTALTVAPPTTLTTPPATSPAAPTDSKMTSTTTTTTTTNPSTNTSTTITTTTTTTTTTTAPTSASPIPPTQSEDSRSEAGPHGYRRPFVDRPFLDRPFSPVNSHSHPPPCTPPSHAPPSTPFPAYPITADPRTNADAATARDPPVVVPGQGGEDRIIFSAIQPSGVPHLGNYLGALREWKRLQDTSPTNTALIFSVADLHAITVPRQRSTVVQSNLEALAALRAIGLNQDRSTIFLQSAVPYHTELQWILSCTASTGYLSRMTQWKNKTQHLSSDVAKHGLFSYPILQAADILLYRSTHVPVGTDQNQHLEFARECAVNFNNTYNTDFMVQPETITSCPRRVMSLKTPTHKMSKSDPSHKSRILISDAPEIIEKRIREAITDSIEGVTYDPENRPGVSNLLDILSALDPKGRTPAVLADEMSGHGIRELKMVVSQVITDELAEVRERFWYYLARPKDQAGFAEVGRIKATARAHPNMDKIRQLVGLV